VESRSIIILGSHRKESRTALFAKQATLPADCEIVDLLDYKIAHYDYEGRYPSGDEFNLLIEKLLSYQHFIFATPVYWYAMSGLMKVFFDRMTDLITHQKNIGRQLRGKSASLIATGYDAELPEGFIVPFKSTTEYLGMEFKGFSYNCTKAPVYKASNI
jgi:multimeric flavodoxin WrbA